MDKCDSYKLISALLFAVLVIVGFAAYMLYDKNKTIENSLRENNQDLSECKNKLSETSSKLSECQSSLTSYKKGLSNCQENIGTLSKKLDDLNKIINLQKIEMLREHKIVNIPAQSYVYLNYYAEYPGYIEVIVHSSTTDKTSVEVIWFSNGIEL